MEGAVFRKTIGPRGQTARVPHQTGPASTSVVKSICCQRRRSGCAQILRRRLAGPSIRHKLKRDLLSLGKTGHPSALDCADMDENVLAAVIRLDEAKTFLAVEPLYGSLRHRHLDR